jgi:hypothetical protein
MGEQGCRACGQTFDYGAQPPPVPTAAQVAEAIAEHAARRHAQAQAQAQAAAQQAAQAAQHAQPPPAAPPQPRAQPVQPQPPPPQPQRAPPSTSSPSFMAAPDDFDSGRADAVGSVPREAIPGFIDSTLFGAYTPRHVDVDLVEGLELTARDDERDGSTVSSGVDPMFEHASLRVETETHPEVMPGLVDSTLFAAYVPENVEVIPMGELEASTSVRRKKTARDDEGLGRVACPSCGTVHKLPRCPACGATHPGSR